MRRVLVLLLAVLALPASAQVSPTIDKRLRSLEARSPDVVVNAKDPKYGLKVDGSTDDRAALVAALASLGTASKTLLIPGQLYLSSGATITIPDNLPVRFEGGRSGFVGPGAGQVSFRTPDGAFNVRRDFGARGDGVTDDTAAIQAAVTAAAGNTVLLAGGPFKVTGPITLPDTHVFIRGLSGTVINGTGTSVFYRRTLADGTGRGFLTKIEGLTFTGMAPAFQYNAGEAVLPVGTEYYELEIRGCRFLQNAGGYAIFLNGMREGLIADSYFETNQGVYATYTVNLELRSCVWKNTTYGVRYATGSEGLKVVGGTMLGVGNGVWAGTNVAGVQILGAMIDYCDVPVYLDATTDILIEGSYISTRTASPAIQVTKSAGNTPGQVRIIGNALYTHHQGVNRVVRVDNGADDIIISGNVIGYWYNGIEYDNTTNLKITENRLRLMAGATGQNSIAVGATGTASVEIRRNIVDKPISYSVTTMVTENIGDRWGGLEAGTDAGVQQAGRVYQGSGAPNNANGANGDVYFRTDTPANQSQRLYVKTAGSWTGTGPTVSADRGDTSQTLTVGTDAQIQRWATTLTANRTVTLSTTGAANGDSFRIARTGLGAFTIDVGPGLKTIPSATAAFVDVAYNGAAWVLTGYGPL